MKLIKYIAVLFLSVNIYSQNETIFEVKNTLSFTRNNDVVSLTKEFLKTESLNNLIIQDIRSKEKVVSQLIDNDGNGEYDELIFQPNIKAHQKKKYKIYYSGDHVSSNHKTKCYSRFVPERIDDYAWENDRVAFRMYGPKAQELSEKKMKGGTLSSGIDAWLKRVDYPIINKWYANNASGKSYHKDRGEGCDNFHVGKSRGVGGIAVKVDETYYTSKNYISYKTITTGPIRTSFILKYEDWKAKGNIIKEEKIITLDAGNNLSKFETLISGTNEISVGLTLHDNIGIVKKDLKNNFISYWKKKHEDSELGIGVVIPNNGFTSVDKYVKSKKDVSNLYGNTKVVDHKVVYYAGFGWKKSNQFRGEKEWYNYLKKFNKRVEIPLIIKKIK